VSIEVRPHQRRHIRPVYLLEIDGWEYRYHSSPVDPASVSPPVVDYPYSSVLALKDPSETSQQLNVISGVVQAGSVSLKLAYGPKGEMGQLLAAGPHEAPVYARLAVTIPQALTVATVTVDREISTAPLTNGVIWIGQEAFAYSARSVSVPWTYTIAARGFYGSQIQRHEVSAERSWAPFVTLSCWSWGNRRARLKVAQLLPNGDFSDWIEEISGYISATPRLSPGGESISLTISPLSAMLRREIGGSNTETTLYPRGHIFDGEVGHTFTIWLGWPTASYQAALTADVLAGDSVLPADTSAHQDMFDISLPSGHPRQGRIALAGAGHRVSGYTGGLEIDPVAGANASQFDIVSSAVASELHRLKIVASGGGAQAVEWPGCLRAVFDSEFGTYTNKGVGGRMARIRLGLEEGPTGESRLEVQVNSSQQGKDLHMTIPHPGRRGHYFAFGLDDPGLEVPMYAPLDGLDRRKWGGYQYREMDFNAKADSGEVNFTELPPIALAWWQTGERWLWVKEDVFGTPGAPGGPVAIRILIEAEHPVHGKYTQGLWVTGKQSASALIPGLPGVVLELPENDRWKRLSFGDFPGLQQVRIRQHSGGRSIPPPKFMLQLLMSTDGSGFNGIYDAVPGGLGLTSEQVNVDSFESFPIPGGVAQEWDLRLTKAQPLEKYLKPILFTLQAAIVPKLDLSDGRRKLTLVKLGLPAFTEAGQTLRDWEVERALFPELDEEICNRLRVKTNYNYTENRYDVELLEIDQPSIDAHRRSAERTLDLRGVEVQPFDVAAQRASLMPMIVSQFALRSHPRRIYRGTCPWSEAVKLDVGSVVLVDAPKGFVPGTAVRGFSSALMRVLEIRRSPLKQRATLRLVWYGVPATGWSPALKMSAYISTHTIEVETNAFSAALSPFTGEVQEDLSFFRVGDTVRTRPRGKLEDAVYSLSITVIDTALHQLTFHAAHGLTMPRGGLIVPEDRTAAPQRLREFCYLVDSTGVFLNGDAGYRYS